MSSSSPAPTILWMEAGCASGGSTTFLSSLLKHIDRSRFHSVLVFYSRNAGPDLKLFHDQAIPVDFLSERAYPHIPAALRPGKSAMRNVLIRPFRWMHRLLFSEFPMIARTWRALRRTHASMVVLNNDLHYHLPAMVACRFSGVPCICRKAGVGGGNRTKALFSSWVDTYVCVSRATERDLEAHYPKRKRAVTIREGVDLDALDCSSPATTVPLPWKSGNKVITSISRMEEGKGQLELIRAAALIVQQFANVRFLLVGDEVPDLGIIRPMLHAEVRRLKLDEVVIFAGWRSDIPQILDRTNVFVHCPTTFIEGQGIATLEAMAKRLPCVVSNNGGLPDAIIDGEGGFVVEPGNVSAMVERILTLLHDDELCSRMGVFNRNRIETVFDIKKNAATFEQVLETTSHGTGF